MTAKAGLKFAMVCACNMNRSMAAHKLLAADKCVQLAGCWRCAQATLGICRYQVASYGTARQVKLPAPERPLASPFGTTYSELLQRIEDKGPEVVKWFDARKLLGMLKRNIGIKSAPERWQSISTEELHSIDVAITFEERVFDALNEDVLCREVLVGERQLHVINLDTKDDPDAANIGAQYALKLVELIVTSVDQLSTQQPGSSLSERIEQVLPACISSLRSDTMGKGSLVPLHMQHFV